MRRCMLVAENIVWQGDDLRINTALLGARLNRGISGIMLANAPKVQSYARTHAPWTDRTGNARQGLFAKYSKEEDSHVITLSHSVPYGIWLEVRWAGRYAVIMPTIQAEAARIMGDIKTLISKLGSL